MSTTKTMTCSACSEPVARTTVRQWSAGWPCGEPQCARCIHASFVHGGEESSTWTYPDGQPYRGISWSLRRIDTASWVREEPESDGTIFHVHLTGPDDTSPNYGTGGSNYGPCPGDTRCGWCYLGANHSRDLHQREVSR